MKHKIICLSVFISSLALASPVDSTKSVSSNNGNTLGVAMIYVDLFGQNLYPSVNYDYTGPRRGIVATGYHLGAIAPSPVAPRHYGVNAAWHWLFGKDNPKLELGVGSAFVYTVDKERTFYQSINTGTNQRNFQVRDRLRQSHVYGFITAGLRYDVPDDRLVVRVYAMPVFGIRNQIYPVKGLPEPTNYVKYFSNVAMFKTAVAMWGGISIGYTLKPRKK